MNLQDLLASFAEQFDALSQTEQLIVIICATISAFCLVGLWRVGRQEEVVERLHSVRRMAKGAIPVERPQLDREASTSKRWYDQLGEYLSTTMFVGPTDRVRLSQLLANAGFIGGKYRLATLIALKLAMLIAVASGAWFLVAFYNLFAGSTVIRFIAMLGAVLLGWRIPDTMLARMAASRRERIQNTLPDALDLMVISAEAGLSFEQGIEFVAREMASAAPDISTEFSITSAELRVLGDRRQALQNFANRINLQQVRSIVATLSQTMRYGTPLAQSLRTLAAEMRSARLLRMEERAARMPVLLTLPLMGFILPSLVIVCAGPAILQAIDGFRQLMK